MGKPYSVTRTTTIAAPADRIRGLLRDFHEWTAWSPWEDVDPAMERTYSGPESGVGAHYAWEGNKKAGKGWMRITRDDPDAVGADLHFDKPFPADNAFVFTLTPTGSGSTTVEWRMTGELSAVMRVFSLVKSMDSLVGPDFEKGLGRLKRVAESPSA
ncbi:SRPBCC family protein [Oryzobacter telluris]|uniref:SRPBCC family protein n=1 Tax=Oryzobacter telluris TaxID=3149179 RepID=UPI00370D933B